jgi:hypothetical protein
MCYTLPTLGTDMESGALGLRYFRIGKKINTRYTGSLAGRCSLTFHTRFLRCNHTGIGCDVPLNPAENWEDELQYGTVEITFRHSIPADSEKKTHKNFPMTLINKIIRKYR